MLHIGPLLRSLSRPGLLKETGPLPRCRALLVAALVLLAAAPLRAEEGFRLVVHPSSPITTLTRDQVSRLFLKKVTRFDHGAAAQPVDQAPGAAVRERFTREIHGKTVTAVKSWWNTRIFSGREVPPPEKGGDDEVLAFVRANAGGIGYVSAGAATGAVKVVRIAE